VAIARLLRERGDLLAARLELVAALASAPRWREATVELARVHKDAKRFAEARQVLAAHLLAVPTDLDALALLADVLVSESRFDDARVAVDRVLRYDRDHGAALWFDGLLLTEQSRLRDAVARWSRLSRLSDAEPWCSRARAALTRVPHTGELSPAEVPFDAAIFDRALDVAPPEHALASASVA
jgi:tetratricopeptide (TPR) repeat protein